MTEKHMAWATIHTLNLELSLAIENCGNREAVGTHLKTAILAHLLLDDLMEDVLDSMTHVLFADVSRLFFALLYTLGQQHSLWVRKYEVDSRKVKHYRIVCFWCADKQVIHTFSTKDPKRAEQLAAAWATLLADLEQDVTLLAVLESGAVINCPPTRSRRGQC